MEKKEYIELEELRRLSFCNSPRLPAAVSINGRRWEWVGIGWIETGGSRKGIPIVVKNGNPVIKDE